MWCDICDILDANLARVLAWLAQGVAKHLVELCPFCSVAFYFLHSLNLTHMLLTFLLRVFFMHIRRFAVRVLSFVTF